ncbi:monocarboxylate transporter 13-like isoform X3 [Amblyomma americanum]
MTLRLTMASSESQARRPNGDCTKHGPDSVHSWLTAVACAFSGFFALAPLRSFGVLFVAIIQEFGVNREEASWTLMLLGGARVLSGLLAGPLAHRFTTRPVLLFGSVVSAGGVMLAYFATNILTLHLTLGIVHGFGSGIVYAMNPVLISEHFVKHQTLATGVCFAGSTLGSFVFPKLIEKLIAHYGFQEAMLVFGALTLNAAAFSLFLRQPRWLRRCDTSVESLITVESSDEKSSPPLPYVIPMFPNDASKNPQAAPDVQAVALRQKRHRSSVLSGLDVLRIPMLYLVMYSAVAFNLGYDCYNSLLVDFAVDKGIEQSSAVTMTSLSSLADLVGRLGLPVIVDRQLLKRRTMMAIVLALVGAMYVVFPQCEDYGSLFALASAVAFLLGSGVVLFPVILVECVGLDRIAMATGLLTALSATFSFAKPSLIGYFRDTRGSYDLLFVACGSVAISTSLAWVVVDIIMRKRRSTWTLDTSSGGKTEVVAGKLCYPRLVYVGDGKYLETRRSRASSTMTVLY